MQVKTITLITPGNTEETQKTRRRLKAWNISFKEMDNEYDNETHMMIKNNGKTSCYDWKSFSTRDKLWELVIGYNQSFYQYNHNPLPQYPTLIVLDTYH